MTEQFVRRIQAQIAAEFQVSSLDHCTYLHDDDIAARLVQPRDDQDMRGAGQPLQAGAERNVDLEDRSLAALACTGRVFRGGADGIPRRSDAADEDDASVSRCGCRVGGELNFAGSQGRGAHRDQTAFWPGGMILRGAAVTPEAGRDVPALAQP